MTTFRNQFLKDCHPETHEMITNAERAYKDGLITREERDDAIRAAIAAETESRMLTATATTEAIWSNYRHDFQAVQSSMF